jgi:hypothetical protein
MAAYAVPFAIPKQPRSLLQPTRRDFATTAQDDFTIEITVYPTDVDTSPYDVTDATSEFVIYDDAGREALTVAGSVVDASAGRIDIDVDGADTSELAGRYSFSVSIEFADGTSTVIHGAVHISSRSGVEAISGSVATSGTTPIDLTEVTIATAVITTAEIGDLTVTGAFAAEGNGTFAGDVTIAGTLGVTKAATFGAGVSITGNASATGTLAVTGAASFSSTVSTGGSVTVTGDITASEGMIADRLWVQYGSKHEMVGAFSNATAPFVVQGGLARVTGEDAPEGRRILNRILVNPDLAAPVASENQGGSVTVLDVLTNLGTAGGVVADSWDGSRTGLIRATLNQKNVPASSASPVLGSTQPALNVAWTTITADAGMGGEAPELGLTTGSHLLDYGNITLRDGAANLTNVRFREYGLFMAAGASSRVVYGTLHNVIAIEGAFPTEQFVAYSGFRKGRASPGWRRFIAAGGQGYAGVDAISGRFLAFEASRSDPIPTAEMGLDVRDVAFSKAAISWPNGEVTGGELDDIDTGAVRVGSGYFRRSATGATIEARGYVGQPSGYVFDLGSDLVNGDPVVTARNNCLGDDEYGGTYRFYGVNGSNEFTRAEVLNQPTAYGTAPVAPISVRLRQGSLGKAEFTQTGTATTTSHPSPMTAVDTDYYVGRYLAYYTGAAAGERQLITAYDATTGVLTTNAFSTSPTASVNVVQNERFQSALPTVEDTIVNSWQFTKNGGTGTLSRNTNPTYAIITGDGTNAVSIDQVVTLTDDTDCRVYVLASAGYTIKVGTSRGDDSLLSVAIVAEPPDEDGNYEYVAVDYPFRSSGTSIWIRIENSSIIPANVKSVRCATDAAGLSLLLGVRAGIEAAPLTLDHVWTAANTLSVQPGGGKTDVGGALAVTGATTAAAVTASGAVTGATFIPTSASAPTNGLYLPATNTLGFAVNSAAEVQLTASALSPAVSDGNALGTSALPWADLFLASGGVIDFAAGNATVTHSSGALAFGVAAASFTGTVDAAGNFSVATSKFTVAAASGNTVVGGTLGVTGATTVAALTTSGDLTVGSSKVTMAAATGNTAIGGTLSVTGTTTAAAVTTSGDVTVGSSKVTMAAATGNTAIGGTLAITGATTAAAVTASGTVTGATFVPSSASVPSNGMYLPSANTLGWAVNSAAELQLTSTALSPAASGGSTLGTTSLPWAGLNIGSGGTIDFANGDLTVTHSTNALTLTGGSWSVPTLYTTGVSYLGGNATAPTAISGGQLYIHSTDSTLTAAVVDAYANSTRLVFRRANTSAAAPSALSSGDTIGAIEARGHDGSAYTTLRAGISFLAAETWTGAAQGGYIAFNTTKIGAITGATERARISANGALLIGGTTDDGTNKLQVTGAGTFSGNVTTSGYVIKSVGQGLTATGTTRTDALQLAAQINHVGTTASGTGVKLPTGVAGMDIVIFNAGANALKVYALSSETIDGTAGSTGVTLSAGARCRYFFTTTNTWISALMGATSA